MKERSQVFFRSLCSSSYRFRSWISILPTLGGHRCWLDLRFHLDPGWNEARVRKVLDHYERRAKAEAVASLQLRDQAVMVVPQRLVPEITRLIEGRRTVGRSEGRKASSPKRRTYSIARWK